MTKRTAIRAAFAALLTGLATTGANVFTFRPRALPDARLPALLISSGESEPDNVSPVTTAPDGWSWRLRVDVLVKEGAASEDTADQILEEVQAAVFASIAANTLGGLVARLRLIGIGDVDYEVEAVEKPCVRVPLVFEAYYS